MDISLQLWSIKDEVEKDFDGALELCARAGYSGVEFAGYNNKTPEAIKELLAKHNLKAVSTHTNLESLRTSFDKEMRYAKEIGFNLVVCSWSECSSEQEIIKDAQFLESCAKRAAKEGIRIGYHNHAQEFRQFSGRYGMDILLENMPSVQFESDVYWIAYAGVDPVAYLQPLAVQPAAQKRICAVHAKEIAKKGKANVYIGEGGIDFKSIMAHCDPAVYPYIVEQEEYSGDHFEGIQKSCTGLKKIFGG
jgi:sugar phosphate isomerase/epimerase